MPSNKGFTILAIMYIASLIIGMILIIVAGITVANSNRSVFGVLLSLGFGVEFFGSIIFIIGCLIIQSRYVKRIRKAIAEESMKYSSKSPIPCSWRWELTGNHFGGFRNQQSKQLGNCVRDFISLEQLQ
jgi:hypothetical protein